MCSVPVIYGKKFTEWYNIIFSKYSLHHEAKLGETMTLDVQKHPFISAVNHY